MASSPARSKDSPSWLAGETSARGEMSTAWMKGKGMVFPAAYTAVSWGEKTEGNRQSRPNSQAGYEDRIELRQEAGNVCQLLAAAIHRAALLTLSKMAGVLLAAAPCRLAPDEAGMPKGAPPPAASGMAWRAAAKKSVPRRRRASSSTPVAGGFGGRWPSAEEAGTGTL